MKKPRRQHKKEGPVLNLPAVRSNPCDPQSSLPPGVHLPPLQPRRNPAVRRCPTVLARGARHLLPGFPLRWSGLQMPNMYSIQTCRSPVLLKRSTFSPRPRERIPRTPHNIHTVFVLKVRMGGVAMTKQIKIKTFTSFF